MGSGGSKQSPAGEAPAAVQPAAAKPADPQAAGRLFVQAAASKDGLARPSACPVQQQDTPPMDAATAAAAAAAGCPVAGGQQAQQQPGERINPRNIMPDIPNEPTTGSLSTSRQASTIPMVPASEQTPTHQQPGSSVWMYPSEQMFFNAMKRKGWDPDAGDMPTVVAIHNTVNERAWREVMAWEALYAARCPDPKLKKFMGRPQDFSPKARFLNLLGYKLPFDRHDWVVDRCGQEVRYVIDFYNGVPAPGMPIAMHVDVRPALDSLEACLDRVRMQMKWVGSGRWFAE